MWTDEFRLIDNEGNERSKKQIFGHIWSAFNEIKSTEEITYPWKVTSEIAKDDFIIDENTTQQDWRDYAEWCARLQ
ncbi:hypothetical protein [Butyrivibrio sp. VCB2006]|jgi:hypothetical protein|uniref:hypothetical protein n=1 Tax=Butyrivibrio sp. VCB2006 TaxID=1280679 RepID=UPI0003FCF1C4|nr:hypothetical protein [Butyrivibrio sp. VCB2006]